MKSNHLRSAFLEFFQGKSHTVLPSSSLVPHGDPTLLLTSAGMVQIKPFFTGEAVPPNPRLASCQKCFRTTDIDEVGDASHLTFFEMLGNFSVGDYFKIESIHWAWEFVTEVLDLPPERLWITVFRDDDEAEKIWMDIGVPKERIVRCGEKENFWGPAGETGPCGPCSEIHYDFGPDAGCGRPGCDPACDCERFLEIWNLVFTEYNKDERGQLTPLPKPNIDTGMGLERTVTLMQGKQNVYETDVFEPVIAKIEAVSGLNFDGNKDTRRAMRVVAEHGRSATFLIADGVLPSNEGRGYVLRRILRRAALFGRKLGIQQAFLTDVAEAVITKMGEIYPELAKGRDHTLKVIGLEENRFDQTLNTGMNHLQNIISKNKKKGITVVSGQEAFKLYDTYGFPIEITSEMSEDAGFSVDTDGFKAEMEAQRERARAAKKFGLADKSAQKFYENLKLAPTAFVGYDQLTASSKVLALIVEGQSVENVSEGQEVEVILSETPFYGEMGGQVGDTGQIVSEEATVDVADAVKPIESLTSHLGTVRRGTLSVGDTVAVKVTEGRRMDIARNHTATHLLHAALREVLGDQVKQGGSLVDAEHFRFDFTHLVSLSKEDLAQIQQMVNLNIRHDLPLTARVLPYKEAIAEGALAFFGDKYGDEVRLVQIKDPACDQAVSAELCGGTHLVSTGQIGFFHILSEKSIGSGLRRIEAVTGRAAEELAQNSIATLELLAEQMETTRAEASQKLESLLSELAAERKRAKDLEARLLRKDAESILGKAVQVDGMNVVSVKIDASDMELVRQTGDFLKDKLGSAVIVLGTVIDGNPRFLSMVTPDLVKKGIHAGNIIKEVAKAAGGGGGGKPEMAQAGGKDASKLAAALAIVPGLISKA